MTDHDDEAVESLEAFVRRLFMRIREHGNRSPEAAERIREDLRRAVAEAATHINAAEPGRDDVLVTIEQTRRRLLDMLGKSGLLSFLAPIIAAVALLRGRAHRGRAPLSFVLSHAGIVVQEAGALLAAVVVVSAAAVSSLLAPVAVGVQGTAGVGTIALASTGASRHFAPHDRRQSDVSAVGLRIEALAGPEPTPSAETSISTKRDQRRVSVAHWVSGWVPDNAAGDGGYAWFSCDPRSVVYRTACEVYDQLPEGPWAH